MYEVILSNSFKKELKKQVKKNPKLWNRVNKMNLLNTNINHRSLKLHKLSGIGYWSISVTDSYRMKIKIEDKYIFCLKFGTHEEVY